MYLLYFLFSQTFLRTLRFCVAVAAALRRMAPKAAHSATHSRSAGNLPASPLMANFSGKSPGAGDSGERVCTYESMVEYYVENFLQDVLKTALQSRGGQILPFIVYLYLN